MRAAPASQQWLHCVNPVDSTRQFKWFVLNPYSLSMTGSPCGRQGTNLRWRWKLASFLHFEIVNLVALQIVVGSDRNKWRHTKNIICIHIVCPHCLHPRAGMSISRSFQKSPHRQHIQCWLLVKKTWQKRQVQQVYISCTVSEKSLINFQLPSFPHRANVWRQKLCCAMSKCCINSNVGILYRALVKNVVIFV